MCICMHMLRHGSRPAWESTTAYFGPLVCYSMGVDHSLFRSTRMLQHGSRPQLIFGPLVCYSMGVDRLLNLLAHIPGPISPPFQNRFWSNFFKMTGFKATLI